MKNSFAELVWILLKYPMCFIFNACSIARGDLLAFCITKQFNVKTVCLC